MVARKAEEERIQRLIEAEKARLIAEHEAILLQHYPKAMQKYNNF
jgi:hypothetical protein